MAFSSIFGHDAVKRFFVSALEADRLGHGFLLEGPEGVGKRTFALEVARSLLCKQPQRGLACGQCSGCKRVVSRAHPDLIVLEREPGAKLLKIDAVRDLQQQLALTPMEGGARVAIIDDAHLLGTSAGNSLLKLLEEPPPRAYLFLVTSNCSALLPTLVSRCQCVRFPPLPREQVTRFLNAHREVPSGRAAAIAALAGGSPGRALEILDRDDLSLRDWLFSELIGSSRPPLERAARLKERLQGEGGKAGTLEVQRVRIRVALELVFSLLRDLAVARAGVEADAWMNADISDGLREASKQYTQKALRRMLDLAPEWLEALESNVSPDLVLEIVSLDVAEQLSPRS
jgi:DNA polymerase-3 subunit delta'